MSIKEIKKNLQSTIDKGGNKEVVEKLQKKLDSLSKSKINKAL